MEEQNAEALEQEANFPEGGHSTAPAPLEGNNSIPTHSGGEHMAEQESRFPTKLYMDLVDTWSSTTRKMAEYYFTTGEQLAKDAMVLQKRATKWTKDTIPLLEEQNNVMQEFLDRSTSIARRLLQIQLETGEETARQTEEMFMGSSRRAA
jgi:hypothetical protein